MPKIFLCAGHGGNDPGALGNGTTEADETRKIVDEAVELLNTQNKDFEIVVAPHELSLIEEVKWINRHANAQDDLTLAVHMNSNSGTPGTGIECYYGWKPMAEVIYDTVVKVTGLPGRQGGVRGDPIMDGKENPNYLHFNRETICRSALLELGFINNPIDLRIAQTTGSQAVANAVMKLFGQEWQDPQVPEWFAKLQPIGVKVKTLEQDVSLIDITTGLAVKNFKAGEQVEVHYQTTISGSGDFYLTNFSVDRSLPLGFRASEFDFVAPKPTPEPEPTPAPEETPTIPEETPQIPAEEPKPAEIEPEKDTIEVPMKEMIKNAFIKFITSTPVKVAAFMFVSAFIDMVIQVLSTGSVSLNPGDYRVMMINWLIVFLGHVKSKLKVPVAYSL